MSDIRNRNMSTEAPRGKIILYQVLEGAIEVDVRLEQKTIWLNLN